MTDPGSTLRAVVEHLERLERLPGSPGEREAAGWIRDRLAEAGLPARLEEAAVTGSFTLPLGLMSAAAGVAGLFAPRAVAAAVTAAAAAGIADDTSGGPQVVRRLLPRRTTVNVVAQAGDPAAQDVLVISAHHDAARGGLIFHPGPTVAVARALPGFYARQETSPQFMRLVAGAPLLSALGALLGRSGLRRAGAVGALVSTAAFADIAVRRVVPGAIDNLAAVAVVLQLARRLAAAPPEGLRVLLLSTGAEESSMEGMRGFVEAHGDALDPARTRFLVLECVGAQYPLVLEGEGMIRMHDYDPELREQLAAAGEAAGVPLRRGLRTGFATDALPPMRAGYRTACLASCDEYKMVPNYHSQADTAANLDFGAVQACADVAERLVRRLSA
jgi:Iap family predicted aminopeptidase